MVNMVDFKKKVELLKKSREIIEEINSAKDLYERKTIISNVKDVELLHQIIKELMGI